MDPIDNHIPPIKTATKQGHRLFPKMTWSECDVCGDWSFFVDCDPCDDPNCKEEYSYLCFFCRNCMCCQPRKPVSADITNRK